MQTAKRDRREDKRRYYLRNRELLLAKNAAYLKQNKAKVSALWAERYRRKKAQILESAKERYAKRSKDLNWKEKELARHRLDYRKSRETKLAQNKRWRDSHREYYASRRHQRRALENAASINLTEIKNWFKKVKSQKWATCYYCQRLVLTSEIHFDHIVPISRGGHHSIQNLCTSCPDCNLSKGFKTIRAWVRVGQQVMEI